MTWPPTSCAPRWALPVIWRRRLALPTVLAPLLVGWLVVLLPSRASAAVEPTLTPSTSTPPTPSPSSSDPTGSVTSEQFADAMFTTHVLLAVVLVLVAVYVLGSLGVWSRRLG